jgi:hypothetical protein
LETRVIPGASFLKSVGRSEINARAILGAIFHENGFKFIYWDIDFF